MNKIVIHFQNMPDHTNLLSKFESPERIELVSVQEAKHIGARNQTIFKSHV